jgi:sugar phosphate isomerase/epimerase
LQPRDVRGLVAEVKATGLAAIQLALEPLRSGQMDPDSTTAALERAGISVPSGMLSFPSEDYLTLESIRRTGGVTPDDAWPYNLAAAREAAAIAARLAIPLVTFHAGFIPHRARDPHRRVVLDRILAIAEPFLAQGIGVALETGQENAITLLDALQMLDEPRIGVNFDPANMILYGMGDPVQALEQLADRVLQVHLKDALPAAHPGQWGLEVPAGDGAVDWPTLFGILTRRLPGVHVMIEREAGEERIEDVRRAAGLAAHHLRMPA